MTTPLRLSVITATFNSAATVASCCTSVSSQSHPVEHIVVDGASSDDTVGIVRRLSPGARILSEPDAGIYDAMNKGIRLATGDVIGILNSDDFYVDDQVTARVAAAFERHGVDAVFADLVFVRPDNLEKVVRYYSGATFSLPKLASGLMPPHPTLFVRRECYEKYGLFKTDYKIAADFEWVARCMGRHRATYHHIPRVLIKMRTGGVSTRSLKSNIILNREILRACAENNIRTNLFKVYSKYFRKCAQLVARP